MYIWLSKKGNTGAKNTILKLIAFGSVLRSAPHIAFFYRGKKLSPFLVYQQAFNKHWALFLKVKANKK